MAAASSISVSVGSVGGFTSAVKDVAAVRQTGRLALAVPSVSGASVERGSTVVGGVTVLRSRRGSRAGRNAAIAARAADLEETTSIGSEGLVQSRDATGTEYHFLIANAKFMLDEEEHFQELMRERLRHFGEQNREIDFWLVVEPNFLAEFPDLEKRLGRPAVALVSTDSTWITFMKLRLDRVLKGVYKTDTLGEALAGGNSSTEIKFEKPGRWTAPYSKYEGPWWTPFLPSQ